jgi:hypothetical protein
MFLRGTEQSVPKEALTLQQEELSMNETKILAKDTNGYFIPATAVPYAWLIELYKTIKGQPYTLPLESFAEDVAKLWESEGHKREQLDEVERVFYEYTITLKHPNKAMADKELIDAMDDDHAREEATHAFPGYEIISVEQHEARNLPEPWHEWPVTGEVKPQTQQAAE